MRPVVATVDALESRVLCSTTYYVSPTGSDANAGTSIDAPWTSLKKVSSSVFQPGDKILFQGGQTFTGRIYFDPTDMGSAATPIEVGSYGKGKATIDAGGSFGIYAYDVGGYFIHDLNFVGGVTKTGGPNLDCGIQFYNDLPGDTQLDTVRIERVDVSGFGKYAIAIGTWNGSSGYNGIRVANSSLHGSGSAGLITYAQNPRTLHNVYVGSVKAFDNANGGIIIGGADGALVEKSSAYQNTDERGLPAIWAYDSGAVTFQKNKAYANGVSAVSGKASGGFGFIADMSNSILRSNDSRDNAGPGYFVASYAGEPDASGGGHVVQKNRSSADAGGGIVVEGRVHHTTVSANRVAKMSADIPAMKVTDVNAGGLTVAAMTVQGNSLSGGMLLNVRAGELAGATDLTFRGNRYRATPVSAFHVQWGDASYASLEAWRDATGQESRR